MTTHKLALSAADASWHPYLKAGLAMLDPHYLNHLEEQDGWLPGHQQIFNAFSLPLNQVNYVLFGESPYPRAASANGYAFWDAAVQNLWAPTGLSKPVNRATSLRNLIKMLLITDQRLAADQTDQASIAALNKEDLVQTNTAFFNNFLAHGFLLLNATLVLQPKKPPQKDAKAFQPFLQQILSSLIEKRPQTVFILLGGIAQEIEKLLPSGTKKMVAEHPYNISFITNPKVQAFFKPLHLLRR